MKKTFTASVWEEEHRVVAQCSEVDVASRGQTEGEALGNLKEALELHFESPFATRAPQMRTIEAEVDDV